MTEPGKESPAKESEESPAEERETPVEKPKESVPSPAGRRLLLDTHVFIWWRATPAKLRAEARDAISQADAVFVSVASAWEAAIKIGLGRLKLPDTMESGVIASGFDKLSITFSHTGLVANLPQHHRDPFDRMLIAQAMSEKLTLVTCDSQLARYGIPILWA